MSEPRRLLDGDATQLESDLLRSAEGDGLSGPAARRVAAQFGVADFGAVVSVTGRTGRVDSRDPSGRGCDCTEPNESSKCFTEGS